LLGIQGWEVVPDGVRIEGERVVVAIRRRAGRGYRCGRCGTGVLFAYDHEPVRQIRDLPLWGRPCWLEVQLARVDCPCCGVTVEAVEWVEPYARQTLRYERYLAQLCGIMPVLDVAELEGVDKNTVYRVDRKWLARRAELRESRPVRHLGIDEIAIKKRHRYATVFYDLDRRGGARVGATSQPAGSQPVFSALGQGAVPGGGGGLHGPVATLSEQRAALLPTGGGGVRQVPRVPLSR